MTASFFLSVAYYFVPELPAVPLFSRILIFLTLSVLSLAGLFFLREKNINNQEQALPHVPPTPMAYLGLLLTLVLAIALLGPFLNRYPWAAPDEVHHLVVARNLGVYDSYASGHPETQLKLFDSYDSVGAPVLAPIALVFHYSGVTLAGARLIIVLYFLLLMIGLFYLIRPLLGDAAALLGLLCLLAAFSSIYLGRTLYGEVPGLCFLVWGLVCWRRSILGKASWRWGFLAGLAIAAAVLCKTILILSAFAFLVVWIYDAFGHRQIQWRHLFSVGFGGAILMGLWWGYQSLYEGDVSGNAASTLGIYQHYLLFGVGAVGKNLYRSVLSYPISHLMIVAGLLYILPLLFYTRYDPASLVLFLVAFFYAYWWLFFTPGQLPRYLWMSYAIAACFGGALLYRSIQGALLPGRMKRRIAWVIVLLLCIAPRAHWTWGQAREVYSNREMMEEQALAAYVRCLPRDARIGTAMPHMRGVLNLLADRPIEQVNLGADDLWSAQALWIISSDEAPPKDAVRIYVSRRYTIYKAKEETESK